MKQLNFLLLLSIITLSYAHEACFDLTGPVQETNSYCTDYSGHSCCSTADDSALQAMIEGLGITDQTCLNYIKQTSCAKCDPWAAHLFGVEDVNPKDFPELCGGYCPGFYQACSQVSMEWPEGKNPFGIQQKIIAEAFPTQEDFCGYYQPLTNNTACYNGTKFVPKAAPAIPPGSDELCLEYFAYSDGVFGKMLVLADFHDKSGRLFAAYQNGSLIALNYTTGSYIDTVLAVPTIANGEAGLIGVAAHPKFAENGKFYIFWSDKNRKADCQNDDWCNGNKCEAGKCTGAYMTNVIQEYHLPAGSNVADPTPLRTLMEISKPYNNHNGGDLIFGSDGYLYVGTGDGGLANDPFNCAQNLNRRAGKILRIDVDATPIEGRFYAVPSDNPFPNSTFPEIYAYGFRNPWRMSFDALNPGYFFVGDVGQDYVEEVDLVKKGGNYGWPDYEGKQPTRTKANKVELTTKIDPIFEYDHSDNYQGPSVIGGYVYRGQRDPCQYGKYILADWSNVLWSALETPVGLGTYAFDVNKRFGYQCAKGSKQCPPLNAIQAFSQDDFGDLYILSVGGSFRVVEPSRCGLTCTATIPTSEKGFNSFTPLQPTLTTSSSDSDSESQTSPVDSNGEETTLGVQTSVNPSLSGFSSASMSVPSLISLALVLLASLLI
eukprot:TRINITY_DN1728_c0_g1_i1.p1 TRINITY_DN1728_c0_g1~~TRINITY_DN1728_c0_g1_i1.p1  ORF type:complete len:659 (-),score=194.62 TRINITY_DN1728_c0_g1_i1:41-2017(-)